MERSDDGELHAITVHLDRMLEIRGMTLTEPADRVGVTIADLSVLKKGPGPGHPLPTLTRLCEVLGLPTR